MSSPALLDNEFRLKARWEALPGPERRAIEARVELDHPELAEMPEGLRRVATRDRCLEALAARGSS